MRDFEIAMNQALAGVQTRSLGTNGFGRVFLQFRNPMHRFFEIEVKPDLLWRVLRFENGKTPCPDCLEVVRSHVAEVCGLNEPL